MDKCGEKRNIKNQSSTSVEKSNLSFYDKLRKVSPLDGANKTLVFTSRFVDSTIVIFGKKTEK